ncbi:MAG: hypothetical protein ACOYN0_12930 [Phycisphaerales bacterium]
MNPTHLVAGLCLLSLVGCAPSNSTRTDIGARIELPSLKVGDERPELMPDDAPSAPTLSRAHWQHLVVEVPPYSLCSNPTYTTQWRPTDSTHRQRSGQYPTASTALEESGGTAWEQRAEGAAAPFVYAWDALLLLPRMVMTPPWREVPAASETYARSPTGTRKAPVAPAMAPRAPADAEAAK